MEQKDKAKRIVKAQQVKLKTLQDEIATLKESKTENEKLKVEIQEKTKLIGRL